MQSVKEIRQRFQAAGPAEWAVLAEEYREDPRAGVQACIKAAEKKAQDLQAELERVRGLKYYERQYAPYGVVCGMDEVGRGPLAGPVVACAMILPQEAEILYVNDSKKLSEAKREELFDVITKEAVAYGIGIVSQERIDEINILQATYEAMREAAGKLSVRPAVFLNDAVTVPGLTGMQVPIIKGDAKSQSIAAASIVAKVTRDRMMAALDSRYPMYGFAQNKGYGTARHMEAIRKYGPCPLHRRSFLTQTI